MIEFSGELSKTCKDVFFKRHKLVFFIILNITWLIIDIPLVIMGVISTKYSYIWFILACLCCITVMLNAIPLLNPQNKNFIDNLPQKVTIENGTVTKDGYGEKSYIVRDINYIKKIVDEGGWYQIIFYFPYKVGDCICQKDLITQGSIEEFEKMFEGLIVRKYYDIAKDNK